MDTFVAIVHVLTALVLIALVLLQDSKSDGLGGAFGGGSNSILGATGATTLAQKMTRGAAVIFAITSIALTVVSKKNTSVVENLPASPVPSTPAATPTSPGGAGETPAAPAANPTNQ